MLHMTNLPDIKWNQVCLLNVTIEMLFTKVSNKDVCANRKDVKIMTCSIEKLIDFRKDVLHLFEEYFSDLIDGTEKKLLNESTVSADTTTTDAVPSTQQPTIVDLFKSTHFRTIYHIFIASLIMLILNLMIQELALNGSINLKLDLFYWCFGKFPMLITIWLSMFSSVVLLLYPSYHCWAYNNFNKDHVTWRNYLLASLGCVLPGSLCFVLAFFAVLHCWMNAFAEMLQFSDRLFYADWWNATSMSSYYRRWNIIVHDWLYTYVYQDMQPLFGDSYRTAAMTVVFLLSAVVHEYIITLTLRFFYPVLFIQFFLCAGPIGIMRLMRSTNTRAWNVCLWFLIMLGNGILMCTYSCEWYARSNCPPNNFLDLIIPRSWTCQADAAEVIRLRR
ncbi:Sterol O-acyltransferase 1 [Trichinella murrelli]|uniref:Sterol O-acyltransferase 1 n=1 Tax=Trichinella murrelli TaxID=144512 RepID=A0A0V0TV47_9BILA|nr:Sterol O-acyltransferase 1 [Trichinella murrelli]